MNRVWLLLLKVEAVSENSASLSIGSEALVQVFVPTKTIEAALTEAVRVIDQEGFRKVDVLSAASFDSFGEEIEAPDFVRKDILQARSHGVAFTGTFFTSQTSASFEK